MEHSVIKPLKSVVYRIDDWEYLVKASMCGKSGSVPWGSLSRVFSQSTLMLSSTCSRRCDLMWGVAPHRIDAHMRDV